jgi:hypothetical protein
MVVDGHRIIEVNGVDLCVDATGDAADPAILLISGMGGPMDWRTRALISGRRRRDMPQSRGMEADDAALRAYYERGMERERLSDGRGDLEFTRTTEIVLRRLPAAPAMVADIGGGPGRYALWLASLGYQVEHRDLVPLHVEQLMADAAGEPGIHTATWMRGWRIR